jgi:hypothetical protein
MPSIAAGDGWTIALIAAVTLALTLTAPVYGLLLSGFVMPLEAALTGASGITTFSIGDVIVAAFLAGWLVRRDRDRPGPRVAAAAAGWLLAGALVARLGLAGGVRAAAGIALVAATLSLFRQHPALSIALPKALVASAALAVLSSVPFGHHALVDGGNSAMAGCLALGMAVRDGGYRRAIWAAAAAVGGAGLYFSAMYGSDTGAAGTDALGIVVLALLAVWIGAGLARTARALRCAPRDARLAGAAAGVLAFLATRLTGPPLLAGGAAGAFWIQFGLMSALAGSTLLAPPAVSAATLATSSSLEPAIRR